MAIERASKTKASNAEMADCYRLRYRINYLINKKNAVRDIEKVIECESSSFKILTYQKILLLLELNLIEEATSLCRGALETLSVDDPARLVYVYGLGFNCDLVQEASKHIDAYDEKKLREDFGKGLINKDELRFFYETRCFLNIANSKFENAHKDITSTIDLAPDHSLRQRSIRTIVLFLMDQRKEAQVDFDTYLPLLRGRVLPVQDLLEVW